MFLPSGLGDHFFFSFGWLCQVLVYLEAMFIATTSETYKREALAGSSFCPVLTLRLAFSKWVNFLPHRMSGVVLISRHTKFNHVLFIEFLMR